MQELPSQIRILRLVGLEKESNMLCDIECVVQVVVPIRSLDKSGNICTSLIATRLLSQLSNIRATEECGYFLAVTQLRSIGQGKLDESSSFILFPVTYCCRTFIPRNGEIMIGSVYSVQKQGVLLKCGPMSHVYLSSRKMPNYYFVDGENPFYLSNDLSRIEMDGVIRFMVFAVQWKNDDNSRQFQILATIEGESLGPISSAGLDGMDL